MTQISTHVLDISRGVPAAGVRVELLAAGAQGEPWVRLALATTDADGRAAGLAGPGGAQPGRHRLLFHAGEYQRGLADREAFLDDVCVGFTVSGEERLHIPLLLSPYGISIYRGS
jgi:5-hydroxyisourate hydrolase